MAVRSGLMEDVNRGPRVEENVEIHMKDKQPKATEADGKEKKQSFESRKLEVIVDVNEDGEIISTSTANQEFTSLPGVVYGYSATLTVRGRGQECTDAPVDLRGVLVTPTHTGNNYKTSYPSVFFSTSYDDKTPGTINEKVEWGFRFSTDMKTVFFALWDTKYQSGVYKIIAEGFACNIKVNFSATIKLLGTSIVLEDPLYFPKVVCSTVQGHDVTTPRITFSEPLDHVFFVHNEFDEPVSYGFLQIITQMSSTTVTSSSPIDEYITCPALTPGQEGEDYNLLDVQNDDKFSIRNIVSFASKGSGFATDVDIPYDKLPANINTHNCTYNDDLTIPSKIDGPDLHFSDYLMMRVGEIDPNSGAWNPPKGTNWIPVRMVKWNTKMGADCISLEEDRDWCFQCWSDAKEQGWKPAEGDIVNREGEQNVFELPGWESTFYEHIGLSPYKVTEYAVGDSAINILCPMWY